MSQLSLEEIEEAEQKLFAAQKANDVKMLDLLLHDDLVAIDPTGNLVTKEMDLNAHRSKSMRIDEAVTVIDRIEIRGDIAITVVTMSAKGRFMGEPTEGQFRYLRVWKSFDGTLKVASAGIYQLPPA